ncbi:MAG: acylphosphatase [Actinobacteria bacterium]|nr:acylphosphatase [Actinomycetota bacterium]
MADERRVRASVSGRVQGVFFRQSVLEEAERLGLSGWVRNTPDGRVELEAQGPADSVDQLVDFCTDGPSAADVDGVDTQDVGLQQGESGFSAG